MKHSLVKSMLLIYWGVAGIGAFQGAAQEPDKAAKPAWTGSSIKQHGLLVMNDIVRSDPLNQANIPVQPVSIFTVRADGTGKKMLTGPGNQYPSWTPAGKIIFVSDRSGSPQVWIMDADGANPKQIGNVQMRRITRVQMAKNGLIAFLQPGDGIWLMQKDGSGLRQLVRFKNGAGDAPSLAISGSWLTYTAPADSTPGHNEIFRINTDRTGLKQLTYTGDPDYPDANASSISPDETMVAIYTGVESNPENPKSGPLGYHNIAVIPAGGGPRRMLTRCHPVRTRQEQERMAMSPDGCVASDNPSWSTDGKWIIYDRGSFNPDGCGTWAIDLKGNNMQRLYPASPGGGSIPLRLAY